jgi:hypothetical protein
MSSCEPDIAVAARQQLSVAGFVNYLTSEEASAVNPAHTQLYMDMNEPLAHYYIERCGQMHRPHTFRNPLCWWTHLTHIVP